MNDNPYFKLCCMAALLASSAPYLRHVPIKSAVSVDPTTGARVSVELSVIRLPDANLSLEASVIRVQEGVQTLSYRATRVLSPHDRNAFSFDVQVSGLFKRIRREAWLWVFDPKFGPTLKTQDEFSAWIAALGVHLHECEAALLGSGESDTSASVPAPAGDDGPKLKGRNVFVKVDGFAGGFNSIEITETKAKDIERGVLYAVIANDCERVKQCLLFTDEEESKVFFHLCREIYGGANVFWAPIAPDHVPDNLRRRREEVRRLVDLIDEPKPSSGTRPYLVPTVVDLRGGGRFA